MVQVNYPSQHSNGAIVEGRCVKSSSPVHLSQLQNILSDIALCMGGEICILQKWQKLLIHFLCQYKKARVRLGVVQKNYSKLWLNIYIWDIQLYHILN